MALLKEIKSGNGITGTYHRIGSVIKNYNKLSVEVESYSDNTYREKEKEFIELSTQVGSLISRLSELTGSPQTEETQVEIDKVTAKINRYRELCEIGQFSAFKTVVQLDWDETNDNISFEAAYEKLIQGDSVFSNAESVE